VEAELRADYPDANVELIQGSGGIFDVVCDGKLTYSKHQTAERRFPEVGEVSKLIRQKMG
jgi:selT/selW/selH-like putative selenoprotein